jgi:hypothetical protein
MVVKWYEWKVIVKCSATVPDNTYFIVVTL